MIKAHEDANMDVSAKPEMAFSVCKIVSAGSRR